MILKARGASLILHTMTSSALLIVLALFVVALGVMVMPVSKARSDCLVGASISKRTYLTAADQSDQIAINDSKPVANHHKIIHVLSTGCVGSCYTGGQIAKHPDVARYFFEPFNGGRAITKPLVRCLWENQCASSAQQYLKLADQSAITQMRSESVLFKTTQFRQLHLLSDILNAHADIRRDYYIVFLIRDPRGAHKTCSKYPSWGESNPKTLCRKFQEMAAELRGLIRSVRGHIKVMAVYNEWIAGLYPDEYRRLLYRFLGLDLDIDVQTNATSIDEERSAYNKTTRMAYATRWTKELSVAKIMEIQSIDTCARWMSEFGYEPLRETEDGHVLLTGEEMTTSKNPYPIQPELLD